MLRQKLIAAGFLLSVLGQALPAYANAITDGWRDFDETWKHGASTYLLDIDNDSLLLRNMDGFYTSGGRITVQSMQKANGKTRIAGWRLGQEIYTPSDIKLPPERVGPPDHPYAGWLYTGWFSETRENDGRYLKLGMDIGCIGPCAGGERTQTSLHRLIHQPLPQGWSRQINNEAGVVLAVDTAPTRWVLKSWIDVTPNLHARFGNMFTDAGVGAILRMGTLTLSPDQSTLHGFARVDARAVGYDATLQGGYFSNNNVHTVKPKTWVGEVEGGLALDSPPFAVRASVVRRSNEIENLSNAIGAQTFARLQFSYTP